jgi:type II secretory pathway pseudopilin PulG
MQTRPCNRAGLAQPAPAFSLIELLTAVSIMVVIIFALYAMFNQTQKALRANITQVDVMEAGRAAAEMIGRDLEQMAASGLSQTINFYAGMTPVYAPRLQTDTDERTILRTNYLQEFFFLSRQTNSWIGTGYRVISAKSGVGSLYRFTVSTNYYALNRTNLMGRFVNSELLDASGNVSTNFQRVVDGIVHLRLTAYDPQGQRLGFETTNMYPTYRILRSSKSGGRIGYSSATNLIDSNVVLQQDTFDPFVRQTRLYFSSNSLPAYVELELGILEPAAYKQLQSLYVTNAMEAFLKKQASKVHLFRQRIPIRTVLQ